MNRVSGLSSVARAYATVRPKWFVSGQTMGPFRKLVEHKIQDNKSLTERANLTHTWQRDEGRNIDVLTFSISKGGNSSIQFEVEENPTGITVSELGRNLSFFHRAFESSLDDGIQKIISSIGAVPKE